MKLHLPNLLRKAVLACMAAGVVLSSTIASASLTQIATMADLMAITGSTVGTGVTDISAGDDTVYSFCGQGVRKINSTAVAEALNASTGYVTIAAWVNPGNSTGAIFSYGDQVKFGLYDGKLRTTSWGKADSNANSLTVNNNDWSLIALTFNLERNVENPIMFLGGAGYSEIETEAGNNSLLDWALPGSNNRLVAIGSGKNSENRETFTGMIGNLAIFTSNTAATVEELASVMGNAAPEYELHQQVYTGINQTDIDLSTYTSGYEIVFDLTNADSSTDSNNYFRGNVTVVVNGPVQVGATGGNGSTGLVISNGSTGNHQIFKGALTGNGLIKKVGAGDGCKISFTGDTTGYSGDITLNSNQNFNLTFGTVVAGNVTHTATPGISSAESGIIGNGAVNLSGTSGKENWLIFNYDDNGKPIYITNTFTFGANANAKVKLNGTAEYIITQETDIFSGAEKFVKGDEATLKFQNAVANITTGTSTTSANTPMMGGTLTKKGVGTMKLATDINYDNIVVQEGTLHWQSGGNTPDAGTTRINATKLTLESGTVFKIDQNVGDHSHLDIVTKGGEIFSNDLKNFATFGTLDMQADATLRYTYNGIVNFTGITGTGNLTIDVSSGANEEGKVTSIGNVHDYTGTVSITSAAQGKGHAAQLGIGTVTLSEGKSFALDYDATSTNFAKYGAGALTLNGDLTINGRFDAFYEGTITLAEGKSISVANNSTLVCKENGTGSRLTLAALPDNLLLDLKGVSETAARAGIVLGLAYSADLATKLHVVGREQEAITTLFTVSDVGGSTLLQLTGDLNDKWDTNWGLSTILAAPATYGESVTAGAGVSTLMGTAADSDNKIVADLTGGQADSIVVGGSNANGPATRETWIRAAAGTYEGIIGGSYANNWGSGNASSFTGDTHILVDGATVGTIIGGIYKDGKSPVFTGDSYISVKSGNVTHAIIGAGTNSHQEHNTFIGDTNIFVYVPLATAGADDTRLSDGDIGYSNHAPTNAVIGGGAATDNVSGTNIVQGNTHVTIDLSSYSGSLDSFVKKVVGGSYIKRAATDSREVKFIHQITGDTNVTIIGKDGISFTEDVIGGSFYQGTRATTIDGSANLSISGGGSYTGTIYGGHYIVGTEAADITASVGNINIDMTGGTVAKLVGGSYVERNAAGSTVKQGDVTLNLEGGSITGNVYAAGSQQGSTTISTGNVAVKLGSALAMTGGTISAGYELAPAPAPANAAASSTITGSRTLELVGSQDRSGVTIDQFDTIKVTTADTTAKVGSITGATGLTKTGAGALQMGASTLESLTVSEGTVALTGDNSLGSISVAANAGLDLNGATTLGADITLANNTSLVCGAADMGGKALTLGTGLNITGTEVDGIITLMSNVGSITGITFDAEGKASADGILASINGVQEIAGWSFAKEDNTLTLMNPSLMVQNVEWSQTNSAYWQNGQEFDGAGTVYQADKKYNVLFGELTGTSSTAPETVQVNGAVVADSMVVDGGEGQVYVFRTDGSTGSGIGAATNGIEIRSGTAVFEAGTLAMTEDTTLTVAGSTLVLHDGAVVNQSAVDIILGNAGTLSWAAGNTTDYSLNGGLSIAEGATKVTLDMGTNVVQLNGEIQGTVSGVTLNVVGNGTLEARPGVLGTAKVVVNGVDLSLASDVEYAASFANTASESMSIAASTGKETTLSGDNSGFDGEVSIGDGTTLVLKGAAALGGNMSLQGTGNVAFAKKDGAADVEFTLTDDDNYTGTTTVREGATLNWAGMRSGDIILDEGSTLKLSSAVANVITDGLDVNATAPGTVVLTSTINPIEWNSVGKTYTGETVVSADTIVETIGSLSTGNGTTAGRVKLSAASSVLKITDAAWDGTWTAGHNVYGAGTVLLESATEKTFTDVLLDGIVASGDGNALANLEIATGNTLKQTTGLNATTGPVYKNIQTITVQNGATYELAGNYMSNNWKNTIVLSGIGVDGAGAMVLAGGTQFASNITLTGNTTAVAVGGFSYGYGTVDGGKSATAAGHSLTINTKDNDDYTRTFTKSAVVRNLNSLVLNQTDGSDALGGGFKFDDGTTLSNIGLVDVDARNLWLHGDATGIGAIDADVQFFLQNATGSVAGTGVASSEFNINSTQSVDLDGDNSGFEKVIVEAGTYIQQDADGSITGVSKDTSTLSLTATTSATLNGNISTFKTLSIDAPTSAMTGGTKSDIGTIELKSGVLTYSGGTFTNIGKLQVADGATMLFKADTLTPGITEVDLKDGAVLSYHAVSASKILKLGTVTANNTDDTKHATIQIDAYNHGIIDIAALNGSDDGELHVCSYGDSRTPCGAIVVNDGDFNGTIQVRQANAGETRGVVLATDDTDVFADAVINFGQTASNVVGAGLVIGGAEDNVVKVAGISSIPLTTVDVYTYTTGSSEDRLYAVTASTAAEIAARTMLVSGGSTNLFANAQTTANTVDGYGDGIDRVLQVTGDSSYDYTGTVGSNLTVKMSGTGTQTLSGKLNANSGYVAAGGILAISGKGQSGSHTFTATGGTLDMDGYAADTGATLDDTIVAAGGTVKDLTLGAGMLLEQTAASTLEGALTLAGGQMAFDLTKTTANGATTYGVGTQYSATTAGASLVIDSTQSNSLLFRTDDLLGYIDATQGTEITGQEGRYYSLITGLTSVSVGTQAISDGEEITTDSLGTNFSDDGRAQHRIVVMEQKDDAGTPTGKFDLMLKVTGAPAILAWTGENGTLTPADATAGTPAMLTGTWDTKLTDNWQIQGGTNAADDMFYSDDSVVFGQVTGDIAQVVNVAADGVKIGTMEIQGGTYTFEGGAITSVEGMGDITISGGNATFNNSITTDGDLTVTGGTAVFNGSIANEGNLTVTGGNVTLNAENTYVGNTSIDSTSGTLTIGHAKALGATTMKDGTTPTITKVDGKMIFNIADANNNVVANRINHHWGHIFAQNNVTLSDVWLDSNGSNKGLSAAEGKELIVTVNSASIFKKDNNSNLNIGNWGDAATGKVTLTATQALSSLRNIVVERGTFNATFNGNVSNGGNVEFKNASTGSMTFNGTAALGTITLGNAAVTMDFKENATLGAINMNAETAGAGYDAEHPENHKLTATFEKAATVGAITGNRGSIDLTVKGLATLKGDIASGTATTTLDFQGGVTSSDTNTQRKLTVNGGTTSLTFGAASTLGAVTVKNAAELSLGVSQGKTASVLNAGTVTLESSSDADLTVTGGLTLKSANIASGSATAGTVKLVGSTLDYSGSNLDANMIVDGASTLKSSYADGSTTVSSGKTISLLSGTTTFAGGWTLSDTVLSQTGADTKVELAENNKLKLADSLTLYNLKTPVNSNVTIESSVAGEKRILTIAGNASVHANVSADVDIQVVDNAAGTTTEKKNWLNAGTNIQGSVTVKTKLESGVSNAIISGHWSGSSNAYIGALTIESGRVTLENYNQVRMGTGRVDLAGESAVLNLGSLDGGDANARKGLVTADGSDWATIKITAGALENADRWQGHVDIVDTVNNVDAYHVYNLGGITSNATVNIGSLNANADTGAYSRLTNVGSLKLVGENSITLIDAMTEDNAQYSLFGTTGAVTLAGGEADSLHIDINSVLESLLGATEGTPKETKFNLGGDLSGLAGKANVIFDTALNLYNLAATFGTDGKLTLTQNVPMEEGSYYDAAAKQGGSTAWVGNGAEELYDSAEGYSAILVNTDTVIDLTGDGVSAAGQADKPGLGMVLNNVNGAADLSIAGNGDDLVTISNTVKNVKLSGDVSVADTDVQILHTKEAHVADDGSVLTVDTLSTDADSELKLVAGKLALAEDGSALLGGVTVADGGHAQLILNGDTTLGGTIATANAAAMLRATGVQWDIDLSNAADVENVALGAGKTATLADGAVVESGVGMKGAEGSTLKLAEGATATISQAASLTGMALEVAEGTELKVDAAYKGGDLSFTDATIAGKLSSMTSDATVSAEAGINLSATEGKTSTISGDLSGYTGWLALKGAGSYKMTTDAAGTDLYVEGSTTTIEAGQDGVISLRSLLLIDNGTLNLNMANDRNVSNKKLNTTEGVTLADGTMNLTANLSKVTEGGVVFTGGKVTVEEGATINLTVNRVSDAVAEDLLSNGASSITLAEMAEGDADVTVINEDQRMSKYFHNAVVKVVDGKLVLTGDVVDGETADYHKQLAETENGKAGASMLDEAYGSSMKEINAAESDVKSMLTYMEDLIAAGNTAGMDEALAAVAGSSTAVLGMAAAGDVERQLKAIRNRTTTMGVDQSVLHEELPYLNAWINAEGDHREMNDDGTLGGYKLNSWGGTVGFDADLTPTFTAGMALTAMYGDLDATGADKATGNMDSYYVSAFARYCGSAWTHTFVGTIGKSDITLDRTVNYGGGSYKTEGETNAMSFGVMYEVGRVFALNEDATTCLQPIFNVTWRHTTVDAYTEKSKGDAALSVDEQTVDTVTFGLGARLQTVVGESIYNRTSILECRVLAKADTGDSSSATSTALQAYNEAKQDVESAEKGNFGVEAGMGLTIPVGQENASIFMDASVELRADYTNVNGTVGYRVNF